MVTSLHCSTSCSTRRIATVVVALLMALCLHLRALEVAAELDRTIIPAGEGALLTLTISGSDAGQPEIPEAPGLIIQQRGRSQQVNFINGRTSVSVSYSYAVGSHTPGDYVIPAISVTAGGEKFSTRPLNLKVLAAGTAPPPPGAPGSPPAGQAGPTDPKRFGFLTVEPASSNRRHVYVGEIAPVRIRAWLPADSRANLRSGIKPEGQAFTLHNVSARPEQSQEILDGKRFLVVTWYGGISATKAGMYPASLSLDATVAMRDPNALRPQRRRGDPFDDPFFRGILDDFDAPMIQQDVNLKSDDREIEVRPLPTDGRPDGFTGAVGSFKLTDTTIPAQWQTGEPQQMETTVTGQGNFALVNAPDPAPTGLWKTYPAKSVFAEADVASFSGSKTFKFNAVARKAGDHQTMLSFSYFDPETAQYHTITSPPQTVRVAGPDLAEEAHPASASAPKPEPKSDGLVAQRTDLTKVSALAPLVERSAFGVLLASACGTAALGIVTGWMRRRFGDPVRRASAARDRSTRAALEAARRCAAANDTAGFIHAARDALQQRLGALWNLTPQAVTLADVTARMDEKSPVARFFAETDRHAYSPASAGVLPAHWQELLDSAISSLPTERP